MCGRYSLTAPVEALAAMFGFGERPNLAPRWNVAPTQVMPVVVPGIANVTVLATKQWGFVGAGRAPLINARAESVRRKPTFREAFMTRRCLVPADGFYEWQVLGSGRKQPWRIGLRGGGVFAFAGLWQDDRFTLITTAANSYLAELHERMPVILAPDDCSQWLQGGPDQAELLLRPYPPELMARYRVTPAVNNVRCDGPECFVSATPGLRDASI